MMLKIPTTIFILLLNVSSHFGLKRINFVTRMSQSTDKFLILGSGSSTRKAILSERGYTYQVCKPDIDERAIGNRNDGSVENARVLVLELANAKADAILSKLPEELKGKILLTADQVIVCNGKILEKPDNEIQARSFIDLYRSHPCSTVGSIVLTDTNSGRRCGDVDVSTIYFENIPRDVEDALIDEGEVMYCAGGLMIEHALLQPYIKHIEGTVEAVMGLSPDCLEKCMVQLMGI